MRSSSLLALPILAAVSALSSCDAAPDGAQAGGSPPPTVKTVVLQERNVALSEEYPGRLAPLRVAEVRARVSGIVLARTFEEGSDVEVGDVLFEIDPSKFAAAVASAKAQLSRANANLALVSQQFDRVERLSGSNVASRAQLDVALANQEQARAEVAVAEASLQTAELELGYASVRSPIAGRIGQAMVTEGALARQEDGTHMATVRDLSAVYVDFTAPLADLRKVRNDIAALVSDRSDDGAAIDLLLDDGSTYGERGRLLFSSAVVEETTGLVSLRALFPNPNGELLPGTYVRVRMAQGIERQALLVPQRAVQRDTLGQASVIVVKDGRAMQQPIVVGRSFGHRVVIEDGLKSGDQIVVDGIERAVLGTPVNAEIVAEPDLGDVAARQSCGPSCNRLDKG